MSDKVQVCLWYESDGEAAARFYCSLLPDSRIDAVHAAPGDFPDGKEGDPLIVLFTLAGRQFQALNGGSRETYTNAASISVECEDQAEVDRLWAALTADGGKEVQCGWLNDRWGVPWQIVPRRMNELLGDPDRARAGRAFREMMTQVKLDVARLEAAADGG